MQTRRRPQCRARAAGMHLTGNARHLHDRPCKVAPGARAAVGDVTRDNAYGGAFEPSTEAEPVSLEELDVPIYSVDPIVRRSDPLQRTVFGSRPYSAEDTGGETAVSVQGVR